MLRIMLVDETPERSFYLRLVLERLGYDVVAEISNSRDVETPDEAVRLLREIGPLLRRFDYGALALAESLRLVLSVELASTAPPAAGIMAELDGLFGLVPEDEVLSYRDTARGVALRVT